MELFNMQTSRPHALIKAFSLITLLILGSWCFALPSENYDPGRLTATTIYDKLDQPMELEVAKDGRIFFIELNGEFRVFLPCLLYTSPSPRDQRGSRMPSSA